MACEASYGDPAQLLPCPCRDCVGQLEFTGPNLVNPSRALVFLECPECGCAHVAHVAAEGLHSLRRERVEEAIDEHF